MSSDVTLLDRVLRLPDLRRAEAWVEQQGQIGTRRSDAWRLWQVAVRAPGAAALEWLDKKAIEAGFELQSDEAHVLLHRALEQGQLLAADWLYARGAPMENPHEGVCLDVEMEPIHVAAMAGRADSVRWIAAHGGVIEPEQDFPMPPLRLAITSAHTQALPVIQALLEVGAHAERVGPERNPGNVLENLMDTIYTFESQGRAGQETFRQLWRMLEEAGANPHLAGRYGRSAAERVKESPQAAWYVDYQRERQEAAVRAAREAEDAHPGRTLPRTSAISPTLLRMSRIRRR